MDAPLDTSDSRLAYMAEVMEGSRKLLAQTYAGLHQVDYVAGRAQRQATVYEWDVLAAARGLLQEAIKTLVSVHDALQRAERIAGDVAPLAEGAIVLEPPHPFEYEVPE